MTKQRNIILLFSLIFSLLFLIVSCSPKEEKTDSYYFSALQKIETGEKEEAVSLLEKGIRNSSPEVSRLCSLFLSEINKKKAIEIIENALKQFPDDNAVNCRYMAVLYEAGKYKDAAVFGKKAAEIEDAPAIYLYNYALINEKLDDFENAILYYSASIKKDPKFAPAYLNLGKLYLDYDSADSAEGLLSTAVKLDPKSFEAVNNLAGVYLAQENYPMAVESFLKAAKLRPANLTVRKNLGIAYAKSGDVENARTVFIEVLKEDKTEWDVYIELARVLISAGEAETAKGYLLTLQKDNPGFRKSEVDAMLSGL